jgi:hypothetical protein
MERQHPYATKPAAPQQALAQILIDNRRAAIAAVERSEAALAAIGVPVESAIRTRQERRAEAEQIDKTP